MTWDEGLGVILRFHDEKRLSSLREALTSLRDCGVPLALLEAWVVVQCWEGQAWQSWEAQIRKSVPEGLSVQILLEQVPFGQDARAHLLNVGLKHCRRRYVAFLDDDDRWLPGGAGALVEALKRSPTAICALGSVDQVGFKRLPSGAFKEVWRRRPYQFAHHVIDLFYQNFIPMGSFVLDRARIAEEDLKFDPTWNLLEDYHFLLRLAARYPDRFNFSVYLQEIPVLEYFICIEGSNTVPLGQASNQEEKERRWKAAEERLEAFRRTQYVTLPLSLFGAGQKPYTPQQARAWMREREQWPFRWLRALKAFLIRLGWNRVRVLFRSHQ